MSLVDLLISCFFIVLCCALAQVARRIVDRISSIHGLVKELILEAIAAAELCSTCFELIIVADNFGVATYAIILFLLTCWWSQVWENASACPYTHMEEMVEGNVTPRDVALKTWAQLMGGCCVWRFVQFFWWLELAQTHQGRAFADCSADLQVSPLAGAFIEGIATLLCRLASKTLSEKGPKYAQILDSFIGTSLVVAGNEKSLIQKFKFKFKVKSLNVLKHHIMYFMILSIILSFILISSFEAFNYSGGYFNPVLSTSLKWGCAGNSDVEHIIVYWIGACTGALVSVPLFKHPIVRNLLLGTDDMKIKDE